MRQLPTFRLVNKSKRKKWYSVTAQFELEPDVERAKFRHPGDAYDYGKSLVDNYAKYAVPLVTVVVEC
jgi:hypothetical protein